MPKSKEKVPQINKKEIDAFRNKKPNLCHWTDQQISTYLNDLEREKLALKKK